MELAGQDAARHITGLVVRAVVLRERVRRVRAWTVIVSQTFIASPLLNANPLDWRPPHNWLRCVRDGRCTGQSNLSSTASRR